MTTQEVLETVLAHFRKMREQGADVVYGGRGPDGRVALSIKEFSSVTGSDAKPENVELRSEEDVRQWLN